MPNDTTRRDLIATLPGLALLLAGEPAGGNAKSATEPPRPAFRKAHRNWHRAWQRYAALDRRAAACGFDASAAGRAALAAMDATLRRIDRIETALAQTPARTLAELRIKIEVLSLDGALRPEFQNAVMADVERMLSAAGHKGMSI